MTASPVKADAMRPFIELLRLLDLLDQDGLPVPCRVDREPFTSDDYRERAEAATACQHCPVLDACHRYAVAAREPFHVWGGHDFTKTTRQPKELTA